MGGGWPAHRPPGRDARGDADGIGEHRGLPAVKKPTEQDTVRAILQFLTLHRIPAWRINTGAVKIERRFLRFGAVGMSDIIAIDSRASGQWIAIEVKSAKGKVTPAQQGFLNQVTWAGGKAFVARSVDDVKQALGL
jgi:hypothetical protein